MYVLQHVFVRVRMIQVARMPRLIQQDPAKEVLGRSCTCSSSTQELQLLVNCAGRTETVLTFEVFLTVTELIYQIVRL